LWSTFSLTTYTLRQPNTVKYNTLFHFTILYYQPNTVKFTCM